MKLVKQPDEQTAEKTGGQAAGRTAEKSVGQPGGQIARGRYRVFRVMPEKNGIKYYIAYDRLARQRCIVSAVSDREQLRSCIAQLAGRPEQSGYLGADILEHVLYGRTDWYSGKALSGLLSEGRLDYTAKLNLVKQILTNALSYDDLPAVLRDSLFDPDYILVEGGAVRFQMKLQAAGCGGVAAGMRELLMAVFTAGEQAGHRDLELVLEMLKREVMVSPGELLHEIERMVSNGEKRNSGFASLRQTGKRCAVFAARAAAAAAAAGILISLLIGGEGDAEPAYPDITAIGTVPIIAPEYSKDYP